MNKFIKTGIALMILVPSVLFWSVYRADTGTDDNKNITPEHASHNDNRPQPAEKKKKIKYWVAPMDPTYIRNAPGKSPMGMDLVPVYEDDDEKSSEGVIKIDPVTVQNIGVRTAPVQKGLLNKNIRTVGRVTYDEKRVEHIHTKISGWVEELHVDTTGEEVKKGQKLLSIYSPELVSTQEEYLQALKYRDRTSSSGFQEISEGGRSLAEAARKRLLFMDIGNEQIELLERSGDVLKNMTLYSAINGTVIEKNVLKGMKVDPMMELYRIADLSRVWVIASIYEYELPLIKTGMEAVITLPYDFGTQYKGRVTFIYPYLSNKTRTIDIRMVFDNPGFKLKPDMYADVEIRSESGKQVILVPSEAILRTGSRSVVITSVGKGRFLPKDVKTGISGEGNIQILSGLEEGEIIVTSGQFLIDSESNLREAINKMLAAKAQGTENVQKTDKVQSNISQLAMTDRQKKTVSEVMDSYLKIHAALIAESASDVKGEAKKVSDQISKLKAMDNATHLKVFTTAIEGSLQGLLSEDLQKARASFKTFSRAMTGFTKGSGREDALSSGLKIYYCPMEKEWWVQKGGDLKNPYLGKEMWICGTEEKF